MRDWIDSFVAFDRPGLERQPDSQGACPRNPVQQSSCRATLDQAGSPRAALSRTGHRHVPCLKSAVAINVSTCKRHIAAAFGCVKPILSDSEPRPASAFPTARHNAATPDAGQSPSQTPGVLVFLERFNLLGRRRRPLDHRARRSSVRRSAAGTGFRSFSSNFASTKRSMSYAPIAVFHSWDRRLGQRGLTRLPLFRRDHERWSGLRSRQDFFRRGPRRAHLHPCHQVLNLLWFQMAALCSSAHQLA